MFVFFPYVIVLATSFLLALFVSIYAYRYRENIGVKEFIFAMCAGAWWILCQCLELMAMDFTVKYIFSSILYIGAGLAAFAYLSLAFRFTGKGHLLSKKNIIIVFIIYTFFFICIFTDIKFGLMRTNFGMDTSTIPYVITKDYSTIYPLYTLYVQSMTFISLVVLLKAVVKGDKLYRRQAVILLAGLLIIVSFNIAYVTKIFGKARFDYAPTVFGIAVTVYFFGIYRHKLLNVIPISRNVLVDIMDSGLLVLDKNDKIIDANHMFFEIFNVSEKLIIGKCIVNIPILSDIFTDKIETINEIDYKGSRTYKLRIKSHVLKKNEYATGIMYIIDDITDQHINNQKMLKQQATISIMNEREKLGRDLHDSFGQIFGYMSIQSQAVKEYLLQNNTDETGKKLDELIAVAKHSHEDIRAFILQMQGSNRKNRNFRVALNQYINDFREKFNMTIDIEFYDNLPKGFPDDKKAFQIIKIIREAFNNIINHAGKCIVNLQFKNIIDDTVIIIHDNGVGFDTNIISNTKGYGLSIMDERAKEAGGQLIIESKIGEGTTVKIIFEKEKAENEDINCR